MKKSAASLLAGVVAFSPLLAPAARADSATPPKAYIDVRDNEDVLVVNGVAVPFKWGSADAGGLMADDPQARALLDEQVAASHRGNWILGGTLLYLVAYPVVGAGTGMRNWTNLEFLGLYLAGYVGGLYWGLHEGMVAHQDLVKGINTYNGVYHDRPQAHLHFGGNSLVYDF